MLSSLTAVSTVITVVCGLYQCGLLLYCTIMIRLLFANACRWMLHRNLFGSCRYTASELV